MKPDCALHALMQPFADGLLKWPQAGGALFLNARAGAPLVRYAGNGLVVVQSSQPLAAALQAAGYALETEHDAGEFPLVLLLASRQRMDARASLAQALDRCAPGGVVVVSAQNASGAKSVEADLRRLAGLDGGLFKAHCRVFWSRFDPARIDTDLLVQWRALEASRAITAPELPGGRFLSRPGVFAWDRIDPGSALLAAHLPTGLLGTAADLGAGWGYLSIELLRRNPRLRALTMIEADARALALARINVAAAASMIAPDVELKFCWHDVAAGLPHRYDTIVSNPPFHAHDRADRPELGQRFIAAAAAALLPRGQLYLVANRHLPYESALAARFDAVRTLAQADGFKVIEAQRPRADSCDAIGSTRGNWR